MDKNYLRKHNLALRKNLNQSVASNKIVSKILLSGEFLSAENILIFYPLKYEINLLKLLNCKEKSFYLPKVKGDYLQICPYKGNLIKGAFNIMEPDGCPVNPSCIDLAYIPSLAVDKNLNRLGYGKGYYDRLFSDTSFKAGKIAVINKELVVDKIDVSEFDIKVDGYITD